MTAIGLDLSLASTGVATSDGQLHTVRCGHTGPRRLHNLAKAIAELCDEQLDRPPVVVEAIAKMQGRTEIAMAELHGAVKVALFRLALPDPVFLYPNQLKKYATGDDKADKSAMMATAWARADAMGFAHAANDDEADAFWLRQIAVDAQRRSVGGTVHDEHAAYRWQLLLSKFGVQR